MLPDTIDGPADSEDASRASEIAMQLGVHSRCNHSEKVRLFAAKAAVWLVVAGALLVHHVYRPNGLPDLLFKVAGSGMLSLAAMGRIWSAAYIAGQKNRRLIQDGPYSVMRHPLYFFSFLGFLGTGLAMESLVLTATMILIFYLTHIPVMRREEERLRGLFGEEYTRYAHGVPALYPKPWMFRCPRSVELQCQAFNRAVFDAALIGLIFIGSEVLKWCHLHGVLPILLRLP